MWYFTHTFFASLVTPRTEREEADSSMATINRYTYTVSATNKFEDSNKPPSDQQE